ncbi:MAG: Do family serine endopeptidase [bacterium]
MERKNNKLKTFVNLSLLGSILFLQTTSACAKENLWYEKNKGTTTAKSEEITKAKNTFVGLAKELNPTVVNIFTSQTVKVNMGYSDDMFRMLDQFMGGRRGLSMPNMPKEQKTMALGSGVLINKEGYIITNNHVVNAADKISVKLFDGKEYDAKVIGTDKETDIAVIKINAKKDLPFAYLGDSSKVEVGEWVIAIGNPIGQSNTVTAGIVSAKGRLVPEVNSYNDFIQTDAAINPGNSGGPLINIDGEVIGINTAITRGSGFVPIEGIGFAIPVNNIKSNLEKLVKGQKVSHKYAWLGVYMGELTPSIAESLGLKQDEDGVVVNDVVKNTPAAKAGLKTYDIITTFDGNSVKTPMDLTMMIRRAEIGKTYALDIIRGKSHKKVNVKLVEKESTEEPSVEGKDTAPSADIDSKTGVDVKTITPDLIKKYKLDGVTASEGVYVVSVDAESNIAMAGVVNGDIILEVNQKKISSDKDFYKNFKNKGSNMLKIKRGNSIVVLAFTFQ